MAILQVETLNGVFGIRTPGSGFVPICLGDKPVTQFLPGWEPVHVLDCLKPIRLLRLRHRGGHDATWILDDQTRHRGSDLHHVPEFREHLIQAASALFRDAGEDVLTSAIIRPRSQVRFSDIPLLSDTTRAEIFELAWSEIAKSWHQVEVAKLGSTSEKDFGVPFMNQTFRGSMTEGYRDKLQRGDFKCPSPFSGQMVSAEIGLLLGPRLTAYRFTDLTQGRVFFLITHNYHDTKSAVVVPDRGLYCPGPWAPDFQSTVLSLLGHVEIHETVLRNCLSGPAVSKPVVNFVSEYPSNHLGHVIWNELGGLADLVASVPTAKLPWVWVMNASQGSEPFGRIDTLFPELRDKVVRPDTLWTNAAAEVYKKNWFFIRYMTKFVTTDLGRRIRQGFETDPTVDAERVVAQACPDPARLCVLIGLRPGNRTVENFQAFIALVIDHVRTRVKAVTIVIEGHNARLGGDATTHWGSSGPATGTEPLIEELQIVLATRRRYVDDAGVEIVSTVGSPMSAAIFWASRATFFIAPWGAGLAKYRWICNRPGFVVTNRFNLVNKPSDLAIYHDPAFMEDPAPMRFIAAQDVQDVGGQEGFYANFEPSPEAVRAEIDILIDQALVKARD